MQKVIVILGAPNDDFGNLSVMAQERAMKGKEIFLKEKRAHILVVGGWGKQFNTTGKPHAFYVKNFLLSIGLHETNFIDFALSSNTFEDAIKSKEIIDAHQIKDIIIVTSDFHIYRTKIIFNKIFSGDYKIIYSGAKSNVPLSKKISLYTHELFSIFGLLMHGL